MRSESPNKIRLAIFDWAGTTIDFGSRAPAAAFVGVFQANGIEVTDDQARVPMGLNKREHLQAMLREPSTSGQWRRVHGRDWTESDVDFMYDAFIPIQLDAISKHGHLVPGLLTLMSELRSRNIRMGGTTGYFRSAADAVAELAASAGFRPDANACADDVPVGRPAPWMIYRVMEQLGIYPPSSVVNVGDTIADIQSGLAAGCWSIGVCDSSSSIGMSQEELGLLESSRREELIDVTAQRFLDAGAHYVLRTITDLPRVIESIEARTPSPLAVN